MADACEQAANFAVATFVEHHFEDRRTFLPAFDSHVLYVGETLGQMNAAMELGEHIALDVAGDLHMINLFDTMARMGETVGKFAVVGDKDQAFGREVEPADTEDARRVGGHQVDDPWAACGIAGGRYHTDRLVDGEIRQLWPRQSFAIDADFLPLRIDTSAQLGHDLSIDFHTALEHQFFALAATGNSGLGEDFLQTLAANSVGYSRRRAEVVRRGAMRRLFSVLLMARTHIDVTGPGTTGKSRSEEYPMICLAAENSQWWQLSTRIQ
ncbi:MAG TPA: hypothetical protein VHE81_18970 [Lacipirellulaceae bacterium]|nr:hypothetical protein [Lacipirellulaceae bacterium]